MLGCREAASWTRTKDVSAKWPPICCRSISFLVEYFFFAQRRSISSPLRCYYKFITSFNRPEQNALVWQPLRVFQKKAPRRCRHVRAPSCAFRPLNRIQMRRFGPDPLAETQTSLTGKSTVIHSISPAVFTPPRFKPW